jgi:putative membrane protein
MIYWNRLGIAAGLATTLALAGPARAQGTGSTGAGGSTTGSSGAGSTTGSTGTGSTTGSSDTATGSSGAGTSSTGDTRSDTGATGSSDTSTTTGGGHAATGATERQAGAAQAGGKVDKSLEQGLQKLHAANQAEVQMGQMAAQTAQDEKVKEFAQQMVDDHQKNDQKLEQLSQQAGVTLTGPGFAKAQKDAEKEMGKLHGKSGAGFDRSYMSHMVKEHQKDIKEVGGLAKKAHKANQAELASFLDETHGAMQGHLQKAKQIEQASKGAQRQGRRTGSMASPRSGTDTSGTGSAGTKEPSGAGGAGSNTGGPYTPPPTQGGTGTGPAGSGTPEPGHRP